MGLTDNDFGYVADLARRGAAIVLDSSKAYLVEARLTSLMKRTGHASIDVLVGDLRLSSWGQLHDQVVEALTTNETSFFRDYHPWETLATAILPPLIEARRASRRLRIWCCACSSGQEPYTIAMIIRERFPELLRWNVEILSTDISPRMVERTLQGRYSDLEINRGLDPTLRDKWFEHRDNAWYARPELRALIRTRPLNLAEPWQPMGSVDVAVIRNVLIYFDVATKCEILERLAVTIASDGVLILGAAETTINLTTSFERVVSGPTPFYRPNPHSSMRRNVLTIGARA